MNRTIINSITSLRILFGLLFLICILSKSDTLYLIAIFTLTAISDVCDGWLSRKYGLATENGAKFDVICDFAFIMLSTSALVLTGLIPAWYLLVIILKIIEFFKTSGETLVYEKLGHFVALMFYAFPIAAVLLNDRFIVLILAIFITICAAISSLDRIHEKFY